jgi:predicted phosphoribosyltransferase
MVCFANRQEAGAQLAEAVIETIRAVGVDQPLVVYALPKGGLPVAAPIARQLNCPLRIQVAKKITQPDNPELAIGAVTADGEVIWVPNAMPITELERKAAFQRAYIQAKAQQAYLLGDLEAEHPTGAIALLVDDGIATGMTMAVAAQSLRRQKPAQVWIGVPVAPLPVMPFLQACCDRAIVLATPDPFYSVSRFYEDFPQVEIEEAKSYLQHFPEKE